jgi:hypothetical protein
LLICFSVALLGLVELFRLFNLSMSLDTLTEFFVSWVSYHAQYGFCSFHQLFLEFYRHCLIVGILLHIYVEQFKFILDRSVDVADVLQYGMLIFYLIVYWWNSSVYSDTFSNFPLETAGFILNFLSYLSE